MWEGDSQSRYRDAHMSGDTLTLHTQCTYTSVWAHTVCMRIMIKLLFTCRKWKLKPHGDQSSYTPCYWLQAQVCYWIRGCRWTHKAGDLTVQVIACMLCAGMCKAIWSIAGVPLALTYCTWSGSDMRSTSNATPKRWSVSDAITRSPLRWGSI